MKPLKIRRIWGRVFDLFLVGDLLAAVFLPFWLGGEDGFTVGDFGQVLAACMILFAMTLALRLAAWGMGRLFDRRVLGSLDAHALTWGDQRVLLREIRALGYRCFPFARVFGRRPSGLWLRLDDELIRLDHAPYWLRIALCFRCPDAHRRPTIGAWVLFGGSVLFCLGVTVWLGI
ncbi:MAG: hypothetical protein IJC15_03755 [Clostridia bacterium]|nr:hypothetical protein [Clostridia bacterium]